MELFFLSDAMTASDGRLDTAVKALVYFETCTPLADVRQSTVSASAEKATVK